MDVQKVLEDIQEARGLSPTNGVYVDGTVNLEIKIPVSVLNKIGVSYTSNSLLIKDIMEQLAYEIERGYIFHKEDEVIKLVRYDITPLRDKDINTPDCGVC